MAKLYVDDTNRIKRVYMDEGDAELLEIDWNDWLNTGESISTSTWTVDNSENLALSNAANASGVTSTLATSPTSSRYRTFHVKNQVTTDASPARKTSRSFRVDIVRRS